MKERLSVIQQLQYIENATLKTQRFYGETLRGVTWLSIWQ